jgi:N-acetylmuramoyl-L-alanine amidase
LAKLAYRFGFDATTVWNDPKNADLRKVRPDPNILWPTDIVYVPDRTDKTPDYKSLVTGTTNSFVSDAPTITVTLAFSGAQFASQPCTISELEQITTLATGADGLLTFQAPVTLETATITFPGIPFTCEYWIGHLDPLNTLSGAYKRLQNLGLIDDGLDLDATNLGLVRGAIRALKASVGGATDADAPPRDPAASSTPGTTPFPDDGLHDDGTLDDATSSLLLAAHGC